ncbi:MAG: putative phage protein (TIGR02218 family), partial [Paracoccaceae bacterium]
MSGVEGYFAHLDTGHTTVCQCWAIRRRDGITFGFTDHDVDLSFEGRLFRAATGLTAKALVQTTGLSVDNSEAVGALSDGGLTEGDILAGRFDGADVESWRVNWSDVAQRIVQFRGTIGEISRAGGAFTAELRGLTEAMNQPAGRVYQKPCSAVLGDGACGFDVETAGYFSDTGFVDVDDARVFTFAGLNGFQERWFERGVLLVTSGAATGLSGIIKNDLVVDGNRVIELWQSLKVDQSAIDTVRLVAGCDKRAASCKTKFGNFLNFQGF